MITENSMMSIQPNEVDVVKIPKDIPVMDIDEYDLLDDKDRERYITDLERHVRSSYEYKAMVQYLREYMNMNSCAFIPEVTNETSRKIRIELHHSPFTLRDICVTIVNKRSRNNEPLTIESVAYEVMFVHYSLMVGLIPLSETVHQLVHSQYIFVPTDKVYGYYKNFVKAYYDYMDPELLDRLDELEKLTKEGTYNDSYKEVLEKKYITVNMEGNNQFEQLHDLQKILKEKMSELRGDAKETPNKDFTNSPLLHPQNIQ
jgi:hypothetical protein